METPKKRKIKVKGNQSRIVTTAGILAENQPTSWGVMDQYRDKKETSPKHL